MRLACLWWYYFVALGSGLFVAGRVGGCGGEEEVEQLEVAISYSSAVVGVQGILRRALRF
ncbi:hypothetical protein QC763_0060780 [Podospora pseudopauciseta]|uniref:Secreted protein n=2 Tax=Podospora TaxID=5144 RepID=A0ABR0HB96_9PEZI|nr:hypothetical protein QC763_0060780 [Podospora pseudopauciseta]KAK4676434.1 hypothetical protein QC764_0060330 [Podospora pseudoanserina]